MRKVKHTQASIGQHKFDLTRSRLLTFILKFLQEIYTMNFNKKYGNYFKAVLFYIHVFQREQIGT